MSINEFTSSNIILGILAILLFSLLGCEDQLLNQTPRGELTEPSFFENEDHAVQATNATYEQLRSFNVHSFPWLGMTEIASDDAVKGSTPSDNADMIAIENFTFSPSNGIFLAPWTDYYQGIFRANVAIHGIPTVEEMDETFRDRLIGENKFLRAYFYFFLVRAYGGVPLLLENKEVGDNLEVPRSSEDEVYSQIEDDLQDAIQVLPLKSEFSEGDLGRATRGAAEALLAKVHLFQNEYTEAQELAESVITSGEYSLYPTYNEIFTREGENSSESIFEVQAVALENELGGTQYSEVQGVRGRPNLGWGFNNPSRDLVESYEAGDPRLEATVLFVHELLPSGEEVVHDNPNMNDERYNQKSFIPIDNPGGNNNSGVNIRRIRFADVLLIAAEAAYHNGNMTTAQGYLNQVRERAREGQTTTIGLQVEALPQHIADTLELNSEAQGPFIRWASDGSTGEAAGINSFEYELVDQQSVIQINNIDIIQSVNGVGVTSPEEYYEELNNQEPGQTVDIEILRVSQSYDTTLNTTSETLQITLSTEQLLPDITSTGEALLEAIWAERRSELAMEQHRFFDLIRQGRAADVLGELGFEEGKHEHYPIPQQEVEISGLQQNPAY